MGNKEIENRIDCTFGSFDQQRKFATKLKHLFENMVLKSFVRSRYSKGCHGAKHIKNI